MTYPSGLVRGKAHRTLTGPSRPCFGLQVQVLVGAPRELDVVGAAILCVPFATFLRTGYHTSPRLRDPVRRSRVCIRTRRAKTPSMAISSSWVPTSTTSAVFDDQDAVGVLAASIAGGRWRSSSGFRPTLDGLLNQRLRSRVSTDGGRLVQDQDLGVFEDRPGDRDPLLLPARQARPRSPVWRIVAVGETHDEVVRVGRLSGPDDLLERDVGDAVGDVFRDRPVKEEGLLQARRRSGSEAISCPGP